MTLLPNALSAIRLFGSIVAAAFVASHPRDHLASLVIVVVAIGIATDFFDGHIARSAGCSSRFGMQLDIVADLACFALLPCAYVASAGTPLTASAPAYLLAAYALMRVRSDWSCRGLPLPVVGTLILMLFVLRYDALLSDSSALATMVTAFISMARDGQRGGEVAAAHPPSAGRVP